MSEEMVWSLIYQILLLVLPVLAGIAVREYRKRVAAANAEIEARIGREKYEFLEILAWRFVHAAEQQFGAGSGHKKYAYVVGLVQLVARRLDIDVTGAEIRALIEAMVKGMNDDAH